MDKTKIVKTNKENEGEKVKGQILPIAPLGALLDVIRRMREGALRAIRRMMPIRRRIYFWRITYSGVVRCPYQRIDAKENTQVIWELTFETPPYFRSYTSDRREMFNRYDRDIRMLIKEQELKMMRWISPTGRLGALTWSKWIEKDKLPESWKKLLKEVRMNELEKEMWAKGYARIPERPILEIRDYSYERVSVLVEGRRRDYIEVREAFERATDRYRFTIYRPPYTTDDQIASWEDDFTHEL
jgi:hypothetical protein